MCALCRANSTNFPWRDFRVGGLALWMHTLWTKANWYTHDAHRDHNLLFDLDGVSILNLGVDLLHVQYLGTDMYFLASVLWLLCYIVLPGRACNLSWEVWL